MFCYGANAETRADAALSLQSCRDQGKNARFSVAKKCLVQLSATFLKSLGT